MKLIDLMKSEGYSFSDMAEQTGLARSAIEKIAYGQRKKPHPKSKRLIAAVFNKPISEIDEFKDEDEKQV